VQTARLTPHARGLALAGRQRHFVSFILKSASANTQTPCSQVGARRSPRFTEGVPLSGYDRTAATRLEPVVNRAGVVPLVHRARLRREPSREYGVEQRQRVARLMVARRPTLP